VTHDLRLLFQPLYPGLGLNLETGVEVEAAWVCVTCAPRYRLGEHVTGLPGCDAACKDDRTLSGLVCGSEKFFLSCVMFDCRFEARGETVPRNFV